jgi:hypothetical protein
MPGRLFSIDDSIKFLYNIIRNILMGQLALTGKEVKNRKKYFGNNICKGKNK